MFEGAIELRDDVAAGLVRFGYAPGRYMGRCRSCDETMVDCDKRATSCIQCAMAAALSEANKLVPIYALRPLLKDATDGPWVQGTDPATFDSPCVVMARYGPSGARFQTDADAKLVATMREAVAGVLGHTRA